MRKNVVFFGFVLCCTVASLWPQAPQRGIPDAHLRVTVKQKLDDQVDKRFHLLELSCWNGECTLVTLTLNGCQNAILGRQQFFVPKIEMASTRDGSLKVSISDT